MLSCLFKLPDALDFIFDYMGLPFGLSYLIFTLNGLSVVVDSFVLGSLEYVVRILSFFLVPVDFVKHCIYEAISTSFLVLSPKIFIIQYMVMKRSIL